jgi:hypothetical protein
LNPTTCAGTGRTQTNSRHPASNESSPLSTRPKATSQRPSMFSRQPRPRSNPRTVGQTATRARHLQSPLLRNWDEHGRGRRNATRHATSTGPPQPVSAPAPRHSICR